MFAKFFLLFAIGISSPTISITFACNSNVDCELNGKCINNTCECNSGWKGQSCSTLNLTIAPNPDLGVWPLSQSHASESSYSWGFSVVTSMTEDDADLYHAYVNTGCCNFSDQTQPMISGTFLLHITSTSPYGPFISSDIVTPITSYNPHIVYSAKIKKYLLFFDIKEISTNSTYCFGNNSVSKVDIFGSKLVPYSMNVAVSNSPYGAWSVTALSIVNTPDANISDPSAIELSNGTWVLSYRYTEENMIGIAASKDDYSGPYWNIANLSVPGEDPFLWQSKIDNSFHIIFNSLDSSQIYSDWPSLHAFSTDLYNWNVSQSFSNFGIGCYSTEVIWSDGSDSDFYKRARPEIIFDDENGNPLYFYSAVQENMCGQHWGYSYSVIQNIGQ